MKCHPIIVSIRLVVMVCCIELLAAQETGPVEKFTANRQHLDAKFLNIPQISPAILLIDFVKDTRKMTGIISNRQIERATTEVLTCSAPQFETAIQLIIIRIQAGGADRDSLMDLIKVLINVEIPTVAYIQHQAFNEAAWIALSCDQIFMDVNAKIGGSVNDDRLTDPRSIQIERHNAELIRDVAIIKGKNGDVVKAFFYPGFNLKRVDKEGLKLWLSDSSIQAIRRLQPQVALKIINTETRKENQVLVLDERQAMSKTYRISHGIVRSLSELTRRYQLETVIWIQQPKRLLQQPVAQIETEIQIAGLFLMILVVLLLLSEMRFKLHGLGLLPAFFFLFTLSCYAVYQEAYYGICLSSWICSAFIFRISLKQNTTRPVLICLSWILLAMGFLLLFTSPLKVAEQFNTTMDAWIIFVLFLTGGFFAGLGFGLLSVQLSRKKISQQGSEGGYEH